MLELNNVLIEGWRPAQCTMHKVPNAPISMVKFMFFTFCLTEKTSQNGTIFTIFTDKNISSIRVRLCSVYDAHNGMHFEIYNYNYVNSKL